MSKICIILLATILIVFCKNPTSLSSSEEAAIIESVRQTLDEYCTDIRRSGLTAEFKYLDNSSDFFWVPPGYASAITYDSVSAVLMREAPKYKLVDNAFESLHVVPLSEALAIYTGRIKSQMTDISDSLFTFSLMETGVMIRRNDGGKLLCGQTAVIDQ